MQTVPQTETILLSYFETGDTPTADQYAEFIRTMFYLYNEIQSASAEASADAASAAALVKTGGALCWFRLVRSGTNFTNYTYALAGLAGAAVTVAGDHSLFTVTVVFTNPAASANFIVLGGTPSAKTTNGFTLGVTAATTPLLEVVVFAP